MLRETDLFGNTVDKVKKAIKLLRLCHPKDGYYVAFSGGKDSMVILDLVKRAGVKYDAHHNLTTVEPPELIYFIRKNYPDVITELPDKTMWQLIEKNQIPPTRIMRYCCQDLKERGGEGRVVITGIRHAESQQRSKRLQQEVCYHHNGKRFMHIIIDWTESDVWEYIRERNLPYCELYDQGFTRIGCVMCPFHGHAGMKQDEARWPKIAAAYKAACDRAFAARISAGKKTDWSSGEEMYTWWKSQRKDKEAPGQKTLTFGIWDVEEAT